MLDKSYYLNRVPPQHRRPKFMSWLTKHIDIADDAVNAIETISPKFEIETAVGAQLDVTGVIVGRKRLLNFEPPNGLSPVLDDDLYRTLQKAKISINNWNGTIPGMYELWNNLFPYFSVIVEDNQDMSMNVKIVGDTLVLERELMSRGYITPKPEGVRINYSFVVPSYEINTQIFVGGAEIGDISYVTLPSIIRTKHSFDKVTIYAGGYTMKDYTYAFIDAKPIN